MTTRPRSVPTIALLTLLAASFAVPAAAQQLTHPGPPIEGQDSPDAPTSPGTTEVGRPAPLPEYGTSQWIAYTVGACDAFVQYGSATVSDNGCTYMEATAPSTTAYIGAGVHLPGGALVQYTRVFFYSSAAGQTPVFGFYKLGNTDGSFTTLMTIAPTSVAGNQTTVSAPFSDTVDNSSFTYLFRAAVPRGASATTQFRQFVVYYKLQVSPGPATAAFTDVPTDHWAFRYVEALRASGITGGCGAGLFCPTSTVTRAEMAVFLAKALGLQYDY